MSDESEQGRSEDDVFSTDTGSIQATYRHVPFEVKSLYSPSGVWTAYVTSDAISSSIFPNPPTYTTRDEALAAMVRAAIVALDTILDEGEAMLQQLGRGQPVQFQVDNPASNMARTMAEGLLARNDFDQQSELMQRFRRAFEQSQK